MKSVIFTTAIQLLSAIPTQYGSVMAPLLNTKNLKSEHVNEDHWIIHLKKPVSCKFKNRYKNTILV